MRKREYEKLMKVQEKTEREMDWVANLRKLMAGVEGCMLVEGCREIKRKKAS